MNPQDLPTASEDPLFGNSITGLLGCALGDPSPDATPAQPWQAPTVEQLAVWLPQYAIVRMIGRGGMGAVYQGLQATLNRVVAIKLLPVEFSTNAEFMTRFQREAQTLASLSHQGIVTIYDFGQTTPGHLYFVMEYIDGTDLAQLLKEQRLGPDQALELTMQICEALQYAHSQGVVHRDIKPANVLITKGGSAKVADFGLARMPGTHEVPLTGTHQVMGTPQYMAPEQWQGMADQRTDIYALGVMLYEMLTGSTPQGVFDPPSHKSHTDARLDEIVIRAMRQEPARRYQSVSELRAAVENVRATASEDLPQKLPVSPAAPVSRPPTRGGRRDRQGLAWTWWLLGALLIAVMVFAWLFWGQETLPRAPDPQAAAVLAPPMALPPAAPPAPIMSKFNASQALVATLPNRLLTAAETSELLAKVNAIGQPGQYEWFNLGIIRTALASPTPTTVEVEIAMISNLEWIERAWKNSRDNTLGPGIRAAAPTMRAACGGDEYRGDKMTYDGSDYNGKAAKPTGGMWQRVQTEFKPLLVRMAHQAASVP